MLSKEELEFVKRYAKVKRLSGRAEKLALAALARQYGSAMVQEAEQTYVSDIRFIMSSCPGDKSVRRWRRYSVLRDEV